jgi:DNA-directed RNA polymerase specialized sigma24 family protein
VRGQSYHAPVPSDRDHGDDVPGTSDAIGTSWDELVQRYGGLVWAVPRGHGLSPSTAADVAHTTWLRLAEQATPAVADGPGGGAGTWLAGAARQESARAARWQDTATAPEPGDPLLQSVRALPARSRLAVRVLAAAPAPRDAELAAALEVDVPAARDLAEQALDRLLPESGDRAALEQDLREAVARADPPPSTLLAAARAAWSWRTLDAELAPLTAESAHDELLAGSRGPGAARLLSFAVAGLSVDLEVAPAGTGRDLLGRLDPAGPAEVVLRRPDGSTTQVAVDDLGRFVCDGLAPGPVSLRLVRDGVAVRTDWVVL